MLLLGSIPARVALAADYTSVQSGAWTNPATWGGSAPTANADVFIAGGHVVSLDVVVAVATLHVGGSATLEIESGGAVTVCTGCEFWNDGTVDIAGALTLGSGTAVSGDYHNGKTIVVQPGGEFLVRQHASLSFATGTITNNGLTTVDGHVQIRLNGPTTLANNATLEVNGTITNESRIENTGDITIGRVDLGAGMINNERIFTTDGGSVEVMADAFLEGGGFVATNGAVVTNRGRYSLTGSIAEFSSGAVFHNHAEFLTTVGGTLIANAGSTFYNHCPGTVSDPTRIWGTLVHVCEEPPSVTQATVSDIGGDRARLAANVDGDGGVPLSARGFVVAQTALDPDPVLGGTHVARFDSSTAALGTYAVWADGLLPGRAYSFKAYATNSAGATAYSAPGNFTTLALPGAPIIGTAVAGDGHATIAFTPPADAGGAAITHYYAVSEPGALTGEHCGNSPCHILGLTNGTSYRFRIVAVSSIGAGPPSALSNAVTPEDSGAAPTISAVADQTLLEGGSATVQFTVSDDSTPAGNIVVSASATGLFDNDALNAALGGSGSARTLLLHPHPDAWGAAQVTLRATDGDGAWSERVFHVEIGFVNDPPRVELGPGPLYPAGTSGATTLPFFAHVTDGPGEYGDVTLSIAEEADPADVISGLAIDADGTVDVVLSGNDGDATVRVTARDADGLEDGGLDTGSATFRIRVGGVADGGIVFELRRMAPPPLATGLFYGALVGNGGAAFSEATFEVVAPALGNAQWSCVVDTGACTPATGTGAARVRFDLASLGTALVSIEGEAAASTNFVEITATLVVPGEGDGRGRRRAVLIDPVGPDALFGAGFE